MYPSRGRGRPVCDDLMPVESASIVVRKVPLHVTKEQMEQIFLKAGAIKYVYFPKVPRHFTTKYCFIKFHDVRRAREAQQIFDGYRLGDQWLQVVAYDPTYKFRHSTSGPHCFNMFDEFASGHQSARASRPNGRNTDPSTSTAAATTSTSPSRPSSPPPIRFVRQEGNLLTNKPTFLDQAAPTFAELAAAAINEQEAEEDIEENEQLGDSDDDEFGECRVVDNVLLDSEVGFWTWLEQRLQSAGPLHYKATEIYDVLSKLPSSARKQFSWPLGAFRLRDKERFHLIGPFLCLTDQVQEAKSKCLALCCNWRAAFSEFWEPVASSEIRSLNQLIQYLRKMLNQFGPQTVDDMKIRQVLQSLSQEFRASTEIKLATTPGFLEFLDSTNAKKVFGISGNIVYLNQEHAHILQLSTNGVGE